jgi:hypothetical protein
MKGSPSLYLNSKPMPMCQPSYIHILISVEGSKYSAVYRLFYY